MLEWFGFDLIHGFADEDVKPPWPLEFHCMGVLALSRDFFWYSTRVNAIVSGSGDISLMCLQSQCQSRSS
jgi:hypothetical protein